MTQIKEKIQELTQRNFFIDNIRGILIMLVIIGHYLELFFAFSIIRSLFIFIYLFHIPLFVAISGYLSKENFSLLKNFKKILLPYIIFQIIYVLLAYLLHDEHIGTFTIPFWFLWYLPALFVWRFLIYIFKKINLYVLLGSSVLISFLVGAVNYIGYELTLSRIIFFFPWFVLGFLMNKYKKNIKQIHLKPINVVLILTIIFGILFFI